MTETWPRRPGDEQSHKQRGRRDNTKIDNVSKPSWTGCEPMWQEARARKQPSRFAVDGREFGRLIGAAQRKRAENRSSEVTSEQLRMCAHNSRVVP